MTALSIAVITTLTIIIWSFILSALFRSANKSHRKDIAEKEARMKADNEEYRRQIMARLDKIQSLVSPPSNY